MDEASTPIRQYHRLQQSDPAAARAALALALQTPRHRPEALLALGIAELQRGRAGPAFVHVAEALRTVGPRADGMALLGRAALAQGHHALAERLLLAAWRRVPDAALLRIALWQARLAGDARDRVLADMRRALAEVGDADELRFLLRHLAGSTGGPRYVGALRWHPEPGEVSGWTIDLQAPGETVGLRLVAGERSVPFPAVRPDALLAAAGYPGTHGGFRFRIPPQNVPVRVLAPDDTELAGSPLAAVPPMPAWPPVARPGSGATGVRRAGPAARGKPAVRPVDVLIPVYEGLEETLACVRSVLQYARANTTPHRVIVLDDASPNELLVAELAALAREGRIAHIRRRVNLGFIRNVNRGMALHPEHDVVWLNADTRVHGDWLDRLRTAAYARRDTASACPFSNNGELLSFPAPRVSHPMPDVEQAARLDVLARGLRARPVPIESGCGFCLFIKREALEAVGPLDELHLSRGYGEETDWCLRARALGWQHVAAPNVFVAHEGGVSFGAEKALRVKHNNDILRRRYPGAQARFDAALVRDPLAPARAELQRARVALLPAWMRAEPTAVARAAAAPAPAPDAVGPEGSGPVSRRHLLVTGPARAAAGLPASSAPLRLAFRHSGQAVTATLHADLPALPLEVAYRLPEDAAQLRKDLAALPIEGLVYEQLAACPPALLELPARLRLPYVVRGLEREAGAGLLPLLAGAAAVQVPYAALLEPYRAALPGVTVEVPEAAPVRVRAPAAAPPAAVLVADAMRLPHLAARWLAIAQALGRARGDDAQVPLLLVPGHTPWLPQFEATGAAAAVPVVEGLDFPEVLALAGCAAAVSLDADPDAAWVAPTLARAAHLPLYAPDGALAAEAGAHPLGALPGGAIWLTETATSC